MFKRILFILFLIVTSYVIAQEVRLSGTITTNTGEELPYANIIANPVDSLIKSNYTISDGNGMYEMLLKKNNTYTIEVRFMGFQTSTFKVDATTDYNKDFVLTEQENTLGEVVIDLPVTRIGDTIRYNTDKFITGEERVLKDVLKNLPGIEVTKNSDVFFNGKKVSEVLVEDKTFFNGDSKLAVENLPSNAIDKVELLENYNNISFLKQLSEDNALVLNIKLKQNKKRFLFGNVGLGTGNNEFYKAESNLFFYSPETAINAIGNLNNIGQQAFTLKDYINFNGGINTVFDRNFDFSFRDFNDFIEAEDFRERKQQFGAINLIKNATSKVDVSSYFIYTKVTSEEFIERLNFYTEFFENKNTTRQNNKKLGIANVDVNYNPNSETNLDFKTLLKFNDLSRVTNIISRINDTVNNIDLNDNTDMLSLNQNFEVHSKISKNHSISFAETFNYSNNDPLNSWSTNGSIFDNLVPVDTSQDIINIVQDREITRRNFNLILKYFWVLNRNHHIYTTVSNLNQFENLNITENQILDDNVSTSLNNTDNENSLKYYFNDLSYGIHYKFKTGIFVLKPGLFYHRYTWSLFDSDRDRNFQENLLPELNIVAEFNKSKQVNFRYNLGTNFANSSELIDRFYLQTYNSVYRGNPDLLGELFHNLNLSYRSNSFYRGLSLFGNLNYSYQIKGFRNTVEFNGINQFLSLNLLNDASENLIFKGHFHKRIKKIKLKLNGQSTFSKFKQPINGIINENRNLDYSIDLSVETFFKDYPNFETGIRNSWREFRTGENDSKFYRQNLFFDTKYDFLKNFIYKFKVDYVNFRSLSFDQDSKFTIADTSLEYKKEKSSFSFSIEAKNLFNANFKQTSNFTDYLISDTRSFIIPRIFILGMQYNF